MRPRAPSSTSISEPSTSTFMTTSLAEGSTTSSRLTALTDIDLLCSNLLTVESWPVDIFDSKSLSLPLPLESASCSARTFSRRLRATFLESLSNTAGAGSKACTSFADPEDRSVK